MKFSKKKILNRLNYSQNQIKEQVGVAIKAYMHYFKTTKQFVGWSVVRMLFPELDHISTLRFGSETNRSVRKNSIKYLKRYFSQYDPAYSYGAGLVYFIFRHGLMHQDFPKIIRRRYNKIVFRKLGLSDIGTFSTKLKIQGNQIALDITDFYHILLKSIDDYKNEFKDKNKKKVRRLINNFTKGMNYMKQHKTLKQLVPEYITLTDKKKIEKMK